MNGLLCNLNGGFRTDYMFQIKEILKTRQFWDARLKTSHHTTKRDVVCSLIKINHRLRRVVHNLLGVWIILYEDYLNRVVTCQHHKTKRIVFLKSVPGIA